MVRRRKQSDRTPIFISVLALAGVSVCAREGLEPFLLPVDCFFEPMTSLPDLSISCCLRVFLLEGVLETKHRPVWTASQSAPWNCYPFNVTNTQKAAVWAAVEERQLITCVAISEQRQRGVIRDKEQPVSKVFVKKVNKLKKICGQLILVFRMHLC